MALEPRFALKQLTAALEKHFEAVAARRGPEDLSVDQAYFQLEDAFLNYQEALGEAFEEDLPFDLPEQDED
ncbi:MAG: hypothetical protein RL530_783 [Actinomycetota bacterium]|jgi:hypothetical protein